MTMPPIIGIDLGTTNSLVAYVDYLLGDGRADIEGFSCHHHPPLMLHC